MNCKHCGTPIHKCSSANEYHADDRTQYMKELNGFGCVHEPNHYPASQALLRVNHSLLLKPYIDIICEYDWPNIQDHIDWVCTAPIQDILDWAKAIREDEKEAA